MEPDQVAQLVSITKRALATCGGPAVFFDIGAYFGLYALMMRREGLFDRIVAFEPDAINFAQLGAQLFLNDAAYEIEARRVAVSDRTGRAQMPKAILRKNRGLSGLDVRAPPEALQTVDTIRLDEAYDYQDKLLVMKVDVEGHQAPLLGGMKLLVSRNPVVLQIEIHEDERESRICCARRRRP